MYGVCLSSINETKYEHRDFMQSLKLKNKYETLIKLKNNWDCDANWLIICKKNAHFYSCEEEQTKNLIENSIYC